MLQNYDISGWLTGSVTVTSQSVTTLYTQIGTTLKQCLETHPYIGWSNVTESMVMIRSPCCGYNLAWCVELKREDLSSYSHKIESVYENVHTITSLPITRFKHYYSNQHLSEFYLKIAAKTSWHRYGTKLRHCQPMYRMDGGITSTYQTYQSSWSWTLVVVGSTHRHILSIVVIILPVTVTQRNLQV